VGGGVALAVLACAVPGEAVEFDHEVVGGPVGVDVVGFVFSVDECVEAGRRQVGSVDQLREAGLALFAGVSRAPGFDGAS